MEPIDISPDVKEFVTEHIDSIGQLEILLLLAQTPEKEWSSRAVSQELRSTDAWVESNLNSFSSRGLLAMAESESRTLYRFSPKKPDDAVIVGKLLVEYATFRLRIIQLIYDKPKHHMQRLADAFKFRKDKSDG